MCNVLYFKISDLPGKYDSYTEREEGQTDRQTDIYKSLTTETNKLKANKFICTIFVCIVYYTHIRVHTEMSIMSQRERERERGDNGLLITLVPEVF